MRSINGVSPEDMEKVRLLGLALDMTDAQVVGYLLREFSSRRAATRTLGSPLTPERSTLSETAIHATYEGIRTEAVYDSGTRSVKISTGPLAGRRFKSPSGAAIAVIQQHNPEVNPNRNGWTFWVITESGALLQSIRHRL